MAITSERDLDLRLPIGGLFTLLGILIGGYGAANGAGIDLWWGVVMLVFGGLCLALGLRRVRAGRGATANERAAKGAANEAGDPAAPVERSRVNDGTSRRQ